MVPLFVLALLAAPASAAPLRFAPNLDDDDANGRVDWLDASPDPAENDWLSLTLPAVEGRLSLRGDTATARLWYAGRQVLADKLPATWEPPPGATVQVELGSWFTDAVLVFNPSAGPEVRWELTAAPILLPDPLGPVERTWVMPLLEGDESNIDLLDALAAHLPRLWEPVCAERYDRDRWVQDQFEVAWAAGVTGPMRVLIDSPRDGLTGEAGGFVRNELAREPDTAVLYFPEGGDTSIDGFGNLEVTPPLGPAHPHGRVLVGRSGGLRLQPELVSMLRRLGQQEPLELDTSWLWVGHVDELISFLPDPDAPRGFRVLLPSAALGLQALSELEPQTELPHYASLVGTEGVHTRADAMQGDPGLISFNQQLERERIRPFRLWLARELDLRKAEVGLVPALFAETFESGSLIPRASALTPNMLNLLSLPDERGAVVLVPDPQLRPPGAHPRLDPFVRAFLRALPAGARVRLVDGWRPYHLNHGGVHCATNVQRAPPSEALHVSRP